MIDIGLGNYPAMFVKPWSGIAPTLDDACNKAFVIYALIGRRCKVSFDPELNLWHIEITDRKKPRGK